MGLPQTRLACRAVGTERRWAPLVAVAAAPYFWIARWIGKISVYCLDPNLWKTLKRTRQGQPSELYW
eukprot:COSAG05_NODE_317_length_11545_cov_73.981391_10_plen_67_part_00